MGDVIKSTLMHINDLPRPYSTLTRDQRGLILTLYDYLCYCILNLFLILMITSEQHTYTSSEHIF